MAFSEHLPEFGGLPVVDFPSPGVAPVLAGQDLAQVRTAEHAWRLRVAARGMNEEFGPYFARFLDEADTESIRALVIGNTDPSDEKPCYREARDLLVEHRDRFPNLRSLFPGDVTFEECEVSWMGQTALGPLLEAFPDLTELASRGVGEHPNFADGPVPHDTALHLLLPEHHSLRRLVVQSGGLPGRVCRELDTAHLRSLEHLELWLGRKHYKGDSVPGDLTRVLSGEALPNLRSLGVRNAERTDHWVAALAGAPVTARLEALDLSLGTLTDEGARVLLGAPVFHTLKRLDLHHHYLSEEMEQKLGAVLTASGVELDLSDRQEPELEAWTEEGEEWDEEEGEEFGDYYYTAVGE